MSGRNHNRGPTSALTDSLQAPGTTTAVTISRAATLKDLPEAGPAYVTQAEGDHGNGDSNEDEDHEMAEEDDETCLRQMPPITNQSPERQHPEPNGPMSVPKYLPFAPPNGVRYEKGDEKQLCEMMPIPLWEIDYRLLGGSQFPRLLPPMFHLGWPVGRDKLLELVQREFPELVLYTEADQKGEVLWDSIVYIPDGIIRDFNIPEELHECVQVSEVLHPDGTRQAALCVGDSRIGILRPNPGAIEQIAQRFFDGKDPQWYLDPWQRQWTRKVRILSPEEARKWAADMNAQEAALAGVAGI